MSKTINVLNIDDDEDFITLLKAKLKWPQFQLTTTSSSQDFLAQVKHNKFDLILLDRHLRPGEPTGAQLLVMLRNQLNVSTPIIMLSHHDDYQGIQDCLELGADDYVTKPLDEVLLKSKIQYLLNDNTLELDELHVGRVPGQHGVSTLNGTTTLTEINELGIKLAASFFVRKGALVRVHSDVFRQFSERNTLSMTVSHSELNPTGNYLMTLEFDPDDKGLLTDLKNWLST